MAELRYRIFRLLEERERAGSSGLPTAGVIAETLDEPLRSVVITLRSSAAIGMIELVEGFGTKDENLSVLLKPPAYIYLEAHLNDNKPVERNSP